ncbi:MAG: tRNA preQ1(34) S-adenosylmethionine ribosyltransferase-isomerase QueA [Gammaproteobacteria bacterium]
MSSLPTAMGLTWGVMFSASEYDYELPPELIAQTPTENRADSRLLVVPAQPQRLVDSQFSALGERLRAGDLLVVNDTKVLPARLFGHKAETGGKFELMLERLLAGNEALVQLRTSKSPSLGMRLITQGGVNLEVVGREGSFFRVVRADSGSFLELLSSEGQVPLPPYISRAPARDDEARYQTVFAEKTGAVAAPTAGLHFDDIHLDRLRAQGVGIKKVTLHVGAGTFQPLKGEDLSTHQMHAERYWVTPEVVSAVTEAQNRGGRVVAVGTTVVRSLESAAEDGVLRAREGETSLFIKPGFQFNVVDMMITNFHLPRSTLMVLVSAFAGAERIKEVYRHAVQARYRFFSYGDAMLLEAKAGL